MIVHVTEHGVGLGTRLIPYRGEMARTSFGDLAKYKLK